MLIDLHVHSHHTHGCRLAPRDVLRRARETGLDGVAFTDMNTLEGLEEIRAAGREEGMLALRGAEIVTDRGHYLCFFPDPGAVPPLGQLFGTPPWSAREVVRKVAELGGATVAAHPYDKTMERPSGDFIFTLEGLAAVEGLNARRRGPGNDLAVEAADHMSLPCIGASGALDSIDEVGKAATLFRDPVANEADLVRQIRARTIFCVAIGVTPGAGAGRGEGRRHLGGRREGGGREGGSREGGRRDGGRRGGERRGGGYGDRRGGSGRRR
jgi:predicted metal-dependent phosphoesterase TrpH